MSAVDYRRALHRIPELDNQLPETVQLVQRILAPLPCRVFSPITGSVCAWFDAGKSDAVAFRAELDALPVTEATDLPYASVHPGRMHACGHDAHTAMVLTLAEYAAEHLAELPRNVLFLFQPSEETTGGAGKLCESGVLERYRVRRIFGLHLWPGLEAGTIASRPGPLMARSNEVTVTVEGRSVHMSRADEGLDALTAGISYLQRAYDMMEQLPPDQPRVLRFGKMVSGHSPERHQRPHRAGGEPAHLPGGHLPFLPSAAEGHRPVRGSGDRLQPGRPPQRGLPRRVEPRRALSEDRRPAGR